MDGTVPKIFYNFYLNFMNFLIFLNSRGRAQNFEFPQGGPDLWSGGAGPLGPPRQLRLCFRLQNIFYCIFSINQLIHHKSIIKLMSTSQSRIFQCISVLAEDAIKAAIADYRTKSKAE